MIRPSLRKTLMTQFLLLVYLLIGSGMGNALVLCQESEAFSHFEYNPAGKCRNVCLAEGRSHGRDAQTLLSPLSWSSTNHCLDTSISLDHATAPGARDLLADVVTPALPAFLVYLFKLFPATDLSRLNLAAQPPPSLALISLRTIILLI